MIVISGFIQKQGVRRIHYLSNGILYIEKEETLKRQTRRKKKIRRERRIRNQKLWQIRKEVNGNALSPRGC